MTHPGDVRLQLNDLEAEEARIMRELRELDEKAHAETEANKRRAEQYKDDPDAALTSLLLECEKEVRDAKGYIADHGPPLRIVRLHRGETGPKSATYLSRPRNTGVDFTVPVTLKAYTDIIKRPIFLNQIRDKIKQHKYASTDDYLDDMRLLAKNTSQFNKGPDLAWVVQHARFLLDAAQEAVQSRNLLFREVEEALRQRKAQKTTRQNPSSLSAVGKRKRSHTQEKTNGDMSTVPPVGSAIEIYWPSYRKWYLAYIIAHGDSGTCHLRYDEDNSVQWVTLDHERWRMRNSRVTGAARGKRAHEQPAKRRKAGATASQASDQVAHVSNGITPEDLDAFKIDLFAKFDDLRDSVVENTKDHFKRIDREIIRSDTLSRILVQGEDNRANMEAALENMAKKYECLQKKVNLVLDALSKSAFFDQKLRDSLKGHSSGDQGQRDNMDAEDPKQSASRSVQNHDERSSGLLDPTEGKTPTSKAGEEKAPRTEGDLRGKDRVVSPGFNSAEKVEKDESPDDVRTEVPTVTPDKQINKHENSEGAQEEEKLEKEDEEGQKNQSTKDDVVMADLADIDAPKEPDAEAAMEDDTVEPSGAHPDPKAHPLKGNRPIQDEVFNIEENDVSKGTDDEKEESDAGSESEDSKIVEGDVHGKTAGKQPATRRPAEKEPAAPRKLKASDSQSGESSDEEAPSEKGGDADTTATGDNTKGGTLEETTTDKETSKKLSEETETAMVSASMREAKEQGNHRSPEEREPDSIDRDVGD